MNCLTAKKENDLQIKIVRTANKTNLYTAIKRNVHTANKKNSYATNKNTFCTLQTKQIFCTLKM